jgi:hypothetical protein
MAEYRMNEVSEKIEKVTAELDLLREAKEMAKDKAEFERIEHEINNLAQQKIALFERIHRMNYK